ncbi:hypothetical protein OESDEN_20475 [Oesophagostomum dentatum]|uniref:Uncharacterized protein n=1 Tax=Oesophagostomum dentatum TaxID=61180 RepID=A0A0B1S9F6_OESDE|nr:hypothetical protein OESDEN_20475 [Oesophagostomum dentatum]
MEKKTTSHGRKARSLSDKPVWKKSVRKSREKELSKVEKSAADTKEEGFPYWIFILLLPLMGTLIMGITCFVIYMRAYDKAKKETQESSRKEQQKQIQSESIKEIERFCAGLPMSSVGKNITDSEAASGSYKPQVKEGGIGSIMRDPDLDSAAREEAPRTYKMVYKGDKWKTVDKVPSDISFHIPSETFLSAY